MKMAAILSSTDYFLLNKSVQLHGKRIFKMHLLTVVVVGIASNLFIDYNYQNISAYVLLTEFVPSVKRAITNTRWLLIRGTFWAGKRAGGDWLTLHT